MPKDTYTTQEVVDLIRDIFLKSAEAEKLVSRLSVRPSDRLARDKAIEKIKEITKVCVRVSFGL